MNGHAWLWTMLRSGEKGKKLSQIGKISSGSLAEFFFFFFFFSAHADFLLLFPLTRPQSSQSCLCSLIIYQGSAWVVRAGKMGKLPSRHPLR